MFDSKRFMSTHFTAREEDIPVPDMKDFFEPKEKPVWRVRGLTGYELGHVNQAAERNRNMDAILDGIASSVAASKADAIRKLIGDKDEVPDDVARRIEMLVIGSVAPEADIGMAVKICKHFPIEFYQLTQAISRLTGQGGATKKKPQNSGPT